MTTHRLKTDTLAFSLLGAALAVAAVKAGTALPQSLSAAFAKLAAPPPARGAMQDIAYRTIRNLARAELLLAQLAKKTPAPGLLHGLLCCSLALLCDEDEAGRLPYESHTLVDQAVRAATSVPETAHAKGMVNAVLRRFLREREGLLQGVLEQPAAHWNYPEWWIEATRRAYPDRWESVLSTGNRAPPLTLRVNRRKTSVVEYLSQLAYAALPATQIGPDAVRLERPLPVAQIPGFYEGMVSVQDAAAQMAAPLLDLGDGMRVLDACAAPGGKTGHILECAEVELTALDSDAQRLLRIQENLQRLQSHAAVVQGDATKQDWWDGRPFDRILADVPCTASGIMRRHPDIRWLRRPADAARLATISAAILDNLWQMLGPDGKLLFVTCSVWPEESELQAAAFAERHSAMRLPAPGQLLPTAASLQDHDGLFYALFQKSASGEPAQPINQLPTHRHPLPAR